MKWRLFLITIGTFLTAATSFGQTIQDCPAGLVCISQAAANQAAANVRELEATKQKVTVLETALMEKDKSIAELQALNDKNVADLKAAMHSTEIALAQKTGEIIQCEAAGVRNTAIIDALVKAFKKSHKFGIVNIN